MSRLLLRSSSVTHPIVIRTLYPSNTLAVYRRFTVPGQQTSQTILYRPLSPQFILPGKLNINPIESKCTSVRIALRGRVKRVRIVRIECLSLSYVSSLLANSNLESLRTIEINGSVSTSIFSSNLDFPRAPAIIAETLRKRYTINSDLHST